MIPASGDNENGSVRTELQSPPLPLSEKGLSL